MSDVSPILSLPLMQPAQAQKHVTHNEALQQLDIIVQLVLRGLGSTLPPVVPVPGEVHALGAGASGVWSGHDGLLAVFVSGGWQFIAPRIGWRGWDQTGQVLRSWNGSAWVDLSSPPQLNNLAGIGIGTVADTTNRLAVVASATLLSHAGAGHQLKINKATAGDTASLLYQSGWSGRAEMGLAGTDDFAIKLSADGSVWTDALVLNSATGIATGAAVVQNSTDTGAGRLLRVGHIGAGRSAWASTGGTANALSLTTGSALPSLPTGLQLRFRATAGNTGPATVAVDGLAARSIRTVTGALLPAGYIRSGTGTVITYDGTDFIAERQTERGSGADGDYTRWADGTQICWFATSAVGFTVNVTSYYTWTYPTGFAAPPVAGCTMRRNDNGTTAAAARQGLIDSETQSNWAHTGASAATWDFKLVANGRWY